MAKTKYRIEGDKIYCQYCGSEASTTCCDTRRKLEERANQAKEIVVEAVRDRERANRGY